MLTHFSPQLPAERPFIFTVDTTKTGSANTTFILPLFPTGLYRFIIDWGDGGREFILSNTSPSHIYPTPGLYTIKIWGNRNGKIFWAYYANNTGDKLKITSIDQWGDIRWRFIRRAFIGCTNLIINAKDRLILDLCNPDMGRAFQSCPRVNFDLNSLNTRNATIMEYMFFGVSDLKKDLSGFNIEQLTNATQMLASTDINDAGTTTRYDALLNSWAGQSFQPNVPFHGGTAKYSAAASAARAKLVAAGWTITDGGLA